MYFSKKMLLTDNLKYPRTSEEVFEHFKAIWKFLRVII